MPILINPSVNFGTPVGTLQYRIIDENFSTILGPTSDGLTEFPVGSGRYSIGGGLLVDTVSGRDIVWDDGTTWLHESLDHYLSAALSVQQFSDLNTNLDGLISDFQDFRTAYDNFSTETHDSLAGIANVTDAISSLQITTAQAQQDGFAALGTDLGIIGSKVTAIKVVTDEMDTMIVNGVFTAPALANVPTGGGNGHNVHVTQRGRSMRAY